MGQCYKEKKAVSDILQGNKESLVNEPQAKKVKVEASIPERNSSLFNLTKCPDLVTFT